MKYRFRCTKCGSESERDIPLDEYDRLKHEQKCECGEKMERVIEWQGFAEVMIYLSFLQIALRAFEYPFTVRFGVKAGSYIKTALGTLLALLTATVFIIFEDKLVPFFSGFSLKKLSRGANVLVSVFPVLSVLLYIVSFKISCKLYPKGVERYDK